MLTPPRQVRPSMNWESVETEEKTSRPISWLLIRMPNSFSRATTSSSASTESSPSPSPNKGVSSSIISGLIPSRLRLSTIRRLMRSGVAATASDIRKPLRSGGLGPAVRKNPRGFSFSGPPILACRGVGWQSQPVVATILSDPHPGSLLSSPLGNRKETSGRLEHPRSHPPGVRAPRPARPARPARDLSRAAGHPGGRRRPGARRRQPPGGKAARARDPGGPRRRQRPGLPRLAPRPAPRRAHRPAARSPDSRDRDPARPARPGGPRPPPLSGRVAAGTGRIFAPHPRRANRHNRDGPPDLPYAFSRESGHCYRKAHLGLDRRAARHRRLGRGVAGGRRRSHPHHGPLGG